MHRRYAQVTLGEHNDDAQIVSEYVTWRRRGAPGAPLQKSPLFEEDPWKGWGLCEGSESGVGEVGSQRADCIEQVTFTLGRNLERTSWTGPSSGLHWHGRGAGSTIHCGMSP